MPPGEVPPVLGGHRVLNEDQSVPQGCLLKSCLPGCYKLFFVLNVIVIFSLGVAGINDTSSQTAYPGQLEDTGWSDKSSGVAKVRCCSFFSLSFFMAGIW